MEKGLSWINAWNYTIQYVIPLALLGFLYMLGIGILLEGKDETALCGSCLLMLSLMLSITMFYKLITDGVATALIYHTEFEQERQEKEPSSKTETKPKTGPPPAEPKLKPKTGPPPAKPKSKPKSGPPTDGV